jgi:hypothetical protein
MTDFRIRPFFRKIRDSEVPSDTPGIFGCQCECSDVSQCVFAVVAVNPQFLVELLLCICCRSVVHECKGCEFCQLKRNRVHLFGRTRALVLPSAVCKVLYLIQETVLLRNWKTSPQKPSFASRPEPFP